MIRNLGLPAFFAILILAALCQAPVEAQNALRSVELRLVNLNRGYLRPLRNTTQRLREITGFESVQMLDSRAGVTRCQVKTTLADEAIAKALSLKLIDGRDEKVVLATMGDDHAYQAEARLAILSICDAIRAKQAGTRRQAWDEPQQLFDKSPTLDSKLKLLGLTPKLLDGKFYKAKDYHVDEQGWDGFSVWAGARYEGISLGGYYDYSGNEGSAAEPDPKSNFVGAKLMLQAWNSGFWWVDVNGARFNAPEFERDSTTGGSDSKLAVQAGADRAVTFMQAAARYRFEGETAKKDIDGLVKGSMNNWQIKQALKLGDNYWSGTGSYNDANFKLSWFKHDVTGHLHARIRAHHAQHPMFLDGDVDCEAARDAEFDFTKTPIHWTVGAESDAAVFERRRLEVAAGIAVIRDALFAMPDAAVVLGQKSALSGAALVEALKLEGNALKGQQFSAADYRISAQMLGDVEVYGGTTVTGCESWTLLNLAAKTTLRSYR